MILPTRLYFLLGLPLLAALFSCSARIDGIVREGGAADITVRASLEPRTIALVRSMRDFMGEAPDAPVLDAPAMSRSIAAAPGVRSASLKNAGTAGIEGEISLANVGDFLASGGAQGRFITYTQGQTAGSSSIVVNLDRSSAPELISRLSPELGDYLLALMAPVVSGERSTRQEYLDVLALVYGRGLADEIAAGSIRATVEFPRNITSIQGGTIAAANRAQFEIPLIDLLVLETPVRYEVSW